MGNSESGNSESQCFDQVDSQVAKCIEETGDSRFCQAIMYQERSDCVKSGTNSGDSY